MFKISALLIIAVMQWLIALAITDNIVGEPSAPQEIILVFMGCALYLGGVVNVVIVYVGLLNSKIIP